MGQPLPHKLVDLLREMRAKGVSLAGLREATGLSKDTIIRYTSPGTLPERKWTDAAVQFLREEYPQGKTLEYLAERINQMVGRTDITPNAVHVKVGQLKLLRNNPNNQAKSEGRKAYWRKWREGRVTNNRRCPPPSDN